MISPSVLIEAEEMPDQPGQARPCSLAVTESITVGSRQWYRSSMSDGLLSICPWQQIVKGCPLLEVCSYHG